MISSEKRSGIRWGFGLAIAGVAIAWLLGIANGQEQANKDRLAELHSAELSACWAEVNEKGGTCKIEYLKDRTDTIYGAEVIWEER